MLQVDEGAIAEDRTTVGCSEFKGLIASSHLHQCKRRRRAVNLYGAHTAEFCALLRNDLLDLLVGSFQINCQHYRFPRVGSMCTPCAAHGVSVFLQSTFVNRIDEAWAQEMGHVRGNGVAPNS
jgi:hypothetical protein